MNAAISGSTGRRHKDHRLVSPERPQLSKEPRTCSVMDCSCECGSVLINRQRRSGTKTGRYEIVGGYRYSKERGREAGETEEVGHVRHRMDGPPLVGCDALEVTPKAS